MFPQLFTHTFTTLPVHHHTRSLSHPWSHVQAWAASRIHDLRNTHTSTSAHRLHLHRDTHSHELDSSPQAVSLLSSPSMQVTTSSPIVEPFSDSPLPSAEFHGQGEVPTLPKEPSSVSTVSCDSHTTTVTSLCSDLCCLPKLNSEATEGTRFTPYPSSQNTVTVQTLLE